MPGRFGAKPYRRIVVQWFVLPATLHISHPAAAFSVSALSRAGALVNHKVEMPDSMKKNVESQYPVAFDSDARAERRRKLGTRLCSSSFGDDQMLGAGKMTGGDSTLSLPKTELSASTLAEIPNGLSVSDDGSYHNFHSSIETPATFQDAKDLLFTTFLITGNTVGAGMICLPDFAAGPGMEISAALFMGIFGINLLSGLLIAELAIKQYELSEEDVPSSFKDFADATLRSPMAGNAISSISVFVNWCVLSFALMRAGEIASANLPQLMLDQTFAAVGVATGLIGLVGSQTNVALSRFASVAVTILFISFAALLFPGLANVHDPMGTLLSPGTASMSIFDSAVVAAPIFLTTMIYQNIVPSVTKLLNYDRSRSATAILLGSLIPTLMYMSFCFAVLGGGLDNSVSNGKPFLTAFSVSALAGSSIACVMSLAEEFDSILANLLPRNTSSESPISGLQQPTAQSFSIPSVLLAVMPPLIAGVLFSGGDNFSAALKYAGSYGSPSLYGFLPVFLAVAQQYGELRVESPILKRNNGQGNLVPGGSASLFFLGVASVGYVFQELMTDMDGGVASLLGTFRNHLCGSNAALEKQIQAKSNFQERILPFAF